MPTLFRVLRRYWYWLVALVWLGLMGLVWLPDAQTKPVWFDPAQVAPHPFSETSHVQAFLAALPAIKPGISPDAPLFIRFVQPDCPCEKRVENYHQLLTPSLQKQGLQVVSLTPEDMQRLAQTLGPQLWQWVPSTPAILLIGSNQQPAYFGPYHQTGICNSDNSYLEPVLAALRNGQPVSIINTLVEGCFCAYPADHR